jgi:hypothetical protein
MLIPSPPPDGRIVKESGPLFIPGVGYGTRAMRLPSLRFRAHLASPWVLVHAPQPQQRVTERLPAPGPDGPSAPTCRKAIRLA